MDFNPNTDRLKCVTNAEARRQATGDRRGVQHQPPEHRDAFPRDEAERVGLRVAMAMERGHFDQAHVIIDRAVEERAIETADVRVRTKGVDWSTYAVAQTELPVRIVNILEIHGILTVGQLLQRTRAELVGIRRLDERSVQVIFAELRRLGITEMD